MVVNFSTYEPTGSVALFCRACAGSVKLLRVCGSDRKKGIVRFRTIIFGISLLLLLNGCKTLPWLDFLTGSKSSDPAQVENTPVATRFRVGDRYTFDNPVTRWQVMAIVGERVSWLSNNGDRQVTGFNPLLPAREWRSRNGATGKRIIRDVKGALFPMKVGAKMSFRATVTSNSPPFGWENVWSCRVTGRETVTVLGDDFDTFVVVCGRENPDELTFNYAPQVGHYVVQRVAATAQSPAQSRKLVAYKYVESPPVAQNTTAPEKPLFTPKGKSADLAAKATALKKAEAAALENIESAALKKAKAWKKAGSEVNPGRSGGVSSRAGDTRRRSIVAPAILNALASIMLRTPNFGGNIAPKPAKTVSARPALPAQSPLPEYR